MAQAIERLLATPTMRPNLPEKSVIVRAFGPRPWPRTVRRPDGLRHAARRAGLRHAGRRPMGPADCRGAAPVRTTALVQTLSARLPNRG